MDHLAALRSLVENGRLGLLIDFDGTIVWHREFGRIDNYHGPAGSPLLYRDTVIIYQDQNGGAFVIALDTRTGETRWRTDRSASVGWGTPIAVRVGDHDELIVSMPREIKGYDPGTGKELWKCGGLGTEVYTMPSVGEGLVIGISGSGNSENVLRAIRLAGERSCRSIGLTTGEGGELKGLVDLALAVPSSHMGRLEDCFFIMTHVLCYAFMESD